MYSREAVELLVPAIWDEASVLEVRAETAPDPDMPKAPSVDPRRSTDKVTACADIQRAWKKADLEHRERCALLLKYGMGYYDSETAFVLEVSDSTAARLARRGINKLGEFLNGSPWEEGEKK